MTLAQRTKKQLLATQVALKRRQNNEAQLEKELCRFFKRLKKSVLKGLEEYWSDYQLLQGQVNLMLSPVHEAHKEYYEIIRKYKLREYELGKAEAKRLTRLANKDKVALKAATTLSIQGFIDKDKNSLFGTIPKAEEDLLNRTFRTTENTLNRVDNQLNQIISDGYREGKGINQVANDITQRFDQLADWEARRIARTEINTSHNQATRDQYKEDGVEYTQWIAANDDRTRDSHVDVDGEIIPIDGKYSNGLAFPGDTSGPIEEWINCRCSNAPFVIPYGFMAPSFSPFRESDLVPINTESLGEPTREQLEQNLTQEQRSQYEQYTKAVNEAQAVIDSRFSLPRERLQARTQLEYNLSKINQLKLVANGELARGYQRVVGSIATTPQESTINQDKERLAWLKEQVEFGESHLKNLAPDNPQYQSVQNNLARNRKEIKELEQRIPKESPKISAPEPVRIENTVPNIDMENYKPYSNEAEAKMDIFESKAKTQKVEYMQYFTDDGLVSPLAKGNWGEVRQTGAQRKWIAEQKKAGKKVHGTHNHPTEYGMSKYADHHYTLLSDADNREWLKDARKNLLDSFSAEGPENRVTISKMETFDKFSFDEHQKALNFADNQAIVYVDKYYTKSPGIQMLNEVKKDLRKQGIDWRVKMREDPEWWESVNKDIESQLKEMKTVDLNEAIRLMNEKLNPVGIMITSSPRKK